MSQAKMRAKGKREQRVSGKLPGWVHLVELCTPADSNLGKTAHEYQGVKVMRVTKKMNILNDTFLRNFCAEVKSKPGACLHASLPCTPWSQWQTMAVHNYGLAYARDVYSTREFSRQMVSRFIFLEKLCAKAEGRSKFRVAALLHWLEAT